MIRRIFHIMSPRKRCILRAPGRRSCLSFHSMHSIWPCPSSPTRRAWLQQLKYEKTNDKKLTKKTTMRKGRTVTDHNSVCVCDIANSYFTRFVVAKVCLLKQCIQLEKFIVGRTFRQCFDFFDGCIKAL